MELTLDWWPDRKVGRLAASRTDRTGNGYSLTDEPWKIIEDLFPWEPPTRAGGASAGEAAALLRGHLLRAPLRAPHRLPMEGSTTDVPQSCNLPPAVHAVDAGGALRGGVASADRAAGPKKPHQTRRRLCRRHVRLGKKGG